MPNLDKTRAGLAFLALVAVIIMAALAFFFGDKLSPVQITLLSVLLANLTSEVKAAFSYFFDGTPKTQIPDQTPAIQAPAPVPPAAIEPSATNEGQAP